MSHDAIRSVVNRHSHCIGETRYAFKLKWAAVQKPVDPCDARLLLRVEAIPTSGPTRRRALLHIFTRMAPVEDLRVMLDAALEQYLAEQPGVEQPTTSFTGQKQESLTR